MFSCRSVRIRCSPTLREEPQLHKLLPHSLQLTVHSEAATRHATDIKALTALSTA